MVQCSSLGAGLYRLLRSLVLLDPFERRLALEKLLGQATMEWSADRQWRQTWGKGQGCELHLDDLLKRKRTGPVLGGLVERIGVGAGTLAVVGARTHKAVRLSQAREGYSPKFYIHLVPANA